MGMETKARTGNERDTQVCVNGGVEQLLIACGPVPYSGLKHNYTGHKKVGFAFKADVKGLCENT